MRSHARLGLVPRALLGGLVSACGAAPRPPAPAPPAATELFREEAQARGLDVRQRSGASPEYLEPEIMGSGAALLDHDGDGDLDVFLVGGHAEPDRLFRNDLDPLGGARFVDVSEAAGLRAAPVPKGYGMGAAAADYDNDGRVDLYVTRYGPNRLWRNLGEGRFQDATEAAGVAEERWSVPASFFDFDRDGWLDLYVGNYLDWSPASHVPCQALSGARDYCAPSVYPGLPDRLFRNQGDGTFRDVSEAAGMARARGKALGSVACDFDADGWSDLYVANDGEPNQLWRNQGDGSFSERALVAGAAVNAEGRTEASMGVALGDVDADGDFDLLLAHLASETNTLYLNDGRAGFRDATRASGLGPPSLPFTGFGIGFLDFDEDAILDAFVANGGVRADPALRLAGEAFPFHQRNQLFRGLGGGRFVELDAATHGSALALAETSRGAAFGDLDNDGDTDILVTNAEGRPRLLLRSGAPQSNWLGLALTSASGGRDALGALVAIELALPPRTLWRRAQSDGSYASASDPRVLVSVGRAPVVDEVRVYWPEAEPGGRPVPETFRELPTNRYLVLRQGSGRAE